MTAGNTDTLCGANAVLIKTVSMRRDVMLFGHGTEGLRNKMTNEEAIRVLRIELTKARTDYYQDRRMAFRMAINALKKETEGRGHKDNQRDM